MEGRLVAPQPLTQAKADLRTRMKWIMLWMILKLVRKDNVGTDEQYGTDSMSKEGSILMRLWAAC